MAAVGWAAYILLTQRIGDRFDGILLVITAGAAAQRAGQRHPAAATADPIPGRHAIHAATG
ncbi:hypothetical protein [Egicoccus sp. AB-alg6-2]|uniref:hypothetical protein n=1 Tax=Egicoccus sp. AB-alg6-2 TaxID=3242692 RepID=UPI00359DEDBF